MLHKMKYFALIVLAMFSLSACAPSIGGTDVSSGAAGSIAQVNYGVVTAINLVNVRDQGSGGELVGAGAGAVVGGIIGSLFGGGTGKTLATAGGALLGGLAGYGAGQKVSDQKGYQLTIRLDNGREIAVVQGTDISFRVGQRVQLIMERNKTRVLPL